MRWMWDLGLGFTGGVFAAGLGKGEGREGKGKGGDERRGEGEEGGEGEGRGREGMRGGGYGCVGGVEGGREGVSE